MTLAEQVMETIAEAEAKEEGKKAKALLDAERMADEFSDVKPQPYIVPIERFAGLPILNNSKLK